MWFVKRRKEKKIELKRKFSCRKSCPDRVCAFFVMFNKNKESNKVNTPAWTWKNTVYREARVCDWLRSFVPLVPAPIQKKKTNNTRRPALPFTGSRDRWPHLRPFISFPSGPSGMSYVLITGSSFLFPSILSFGWFTWSNCFPFLIVQISFNLIAFNKFIKIVYFKLSNAKLILYIIMIKIIIFPLILYHIYFFNK